MPRPGAVILFLLLPYGLGACGAGPAPGPAAVIEQFLDALARNDLLAARRCLVAIERRDDTWGLDAGPAKHGFTVGSPEIDGDTAVVPVELGEPRTTIRHVLLREAGAWRLSLQQTTLRMTGFDAKRLRQRIEDSLQKARGAPTGKPAPAAPR
jgi:hypothetical protein